MMNTVTFREMNAHDRALVCIAVLLDGREAASYLEQDAENGVKLVAAANFLSSQQPDVRMPLVGSLLRGAISELR